MFKRSTKIFLSLVIILAVGGIGYYLVKPVKKVVDTTTVKLQDVVQTVSVTGKVKPSQEVELSFEKSGRLASIKVNVGDRVVNGAALAILDDSELRAQLQQSQAAVDSAQALRLQYQAALDSQNAQLIELRRGARPEELKISQTKVDNAKKALSDAQSNLDRARSKAEVDIANLLDDVGDVISDAYAKASDAVNKQIDDLFSDDNSSSPKLSFYVTDSQAKTDAETGRAQATAMVAALQASKDKTVGSADEAISVLSQAEQSLSNIRNFLLRLSDAVNSSTGLAQTTVVTYKGYVNTGLANTNTAITNVNKQKQSITSQTVTNQQNITTYQAKVNDAQNALLLAEDELKLKQAGNTTEQISSQEAKVKQAQLQIITQEAQLKQAQASLAQLQAQLVKATLISPITGIVTQQDGKVGEVIAANKTFITVISNALTIEANVPEADIAKVQVGTKANLTLDAYGSEIVFEAAVTAIDPAETVVEGVSTYKITLQFTKEDVRVKPGMTTNIDMTTAEHKQVLAIPLRAVKTGGGQKSVQVLVNPSQGTDVNNIKQVDIITGLVGSDGNVEVSSGLRAGDVIVTSSD